MVMASCIIVELAGYSPKKGNGEWVFSQSTLWTTFVQRLTHIHLLQHSGEKSILTADDNIEENIENL